MKKPVIPTKLPGRCGSIQRRGRAWWMIYRNADDQIVQENSGTEDQAEALKTLARQALRTLDMKRAALLEIANAKAKTTSARRRTRDDGDGTRRATGAGKQRGGSRPRSVSSRSQTAEVAQR